MVRIRLELNNALNLQLIDNALPPLPASMLSHRFGALGRSAYDVDLAQSSELDVYVRNVLLAWPEYSS